jgi:hypothetical protein
MVRPASDAVGTNQSAPDAAPAEKVVPAGKPDNMISLVLPDIGVTAIEIAVSDNPDPPVIMTSCADAVDANTALYNPRDMQPVNIFDNFKDCLARVNLAHFTASV